MTKDEARACLNNAQERPSRHGEAVDVLLGEYGSYKKIAEDADIRRSADFISKCHAVFKLPKGIQWKVDQKEINTRQAHQIRQHLKNEKDQWLFALAIVERKLRSDESQNIIKRIKNGESIKDALRIVSGVRAESLFNEGIMLPILIKPELLESLTRLAWKHEQGWADTCYNLICQGLSVDMQDVANQLDSIVFKIRQRNGSKLL